MELLTIDKLDTNTINLYLNINEKITNINKKIIRLDKQIYANHSMTGSPMAIDEAGNNINNISITRLVEDTIDFQIFAQHVIEIYKFKQHKFNEWFNTLSSNQQKYFKAGIPFNDSRLNQLALNEIGQIEEATSRKFNYPVEKFILLGDDTKTNIQEMMEALG